MKISKTATAEILGNKAFKDGKDCIPCLDKNLTERLPQGTVKDSHPLFITICKAWITGWTNANLSAGIE